MKTALCFGLALLVVIASPARAGGMRAAQGYLGVDVRDVTPDELPSLKLRDTRGAEIVLVDHDAPAGKAGLRERDVVLMMNGQAIEGQDQLRRMLHDCPPGKTIVLTVSRDGQQKQITAQMAASQQEVAREAMVQRLSMPEPQDQIADTAQNASGAAAPSLHGGNSLLGPMVMNPSYTGLYLEKMSAQLAGYFGVPDGSGLLVRSVQENSPAALAGIHAGDVVVRANDKAVTSTNEWAKAIKNSHGRPLTVVVLRDRRVQTLILTPDSKRRSSLDLPCQGQPSQDLPSQGQPSLDQWDQDPAPVAVARLGLTLMPRS